MLQILDENLILAGIFGIFEGFDLRRRNIKWTISSAFMYLPHSGALIIFYENDALYFRKKRGKTIKYWKNTFHIYRQKHISQCKNFTAYRKVIKFQSSLYLWVKLVEDYCFEKLNFGIFENGSGLFLWKNRNFSGNYWKLTPNVLEVS